MAFRVFVSYSGRNDQVNALRLQTLATTRPGIHVYVPPADSRATKGTGHEREFGELKDADIVLLLFRGYSTPRMKCELEFAAKAKKPVVAIDPENPSATEEDFERRLDRLKLSKDDRAALGALVHIVFGLLILAKK